MWRGIHDGAHSLAQILYNIHHYCVRSGMDIWEVTKGSLKETSELQMGAAGGGAYCHGPWCGVVGKTRG